VARVSVSTPVSAKSAAAWGTCWGHAPFPFWESVSICCTDSGVRKNLVKKGFCRDPRYAVDPVGKTKFREMSQMPPRS